MGILLLLLYSIGHGILAVIAGTSIGFVQKLSQSKKHGKASTILKIVMGGVILLIGFYLFYSEFLLTNFKEFFLWHGLVLVKRKIQRKS